MEMMSRFGMRLVITSIAPAMIIASGNRATATVPNVSKDQNPSTSRSRPTS